MSEGEKILRVGLVGCGAWGTRLRNKCGTMTGVEVVAIADPALGDVPGKAVFASLSALLARSTIDAILIAVPPSLQGRLALETVERGIPTFVEKPMAMSVELADAIATASRRKGVPVCVGHVVRYEPAFEAVLAWFSSGKIGDLVSVESVRIGARVRPDASPLWVLGPHEFSRILALEAGPLRIRKAHVSEHEARVSLGLGDARAEVYVARGPGKSRTLSLRGAKGVISFDESLGRATLETEGGAVETFEERGDPLGAELAAFFSAVRNRTPLRTDASEGGRVVRALALVEEWAKRSSSLEGVDPHALARAE